jgi:hypothetical protein
MMQTPEEFWATSRRYRYSDMQAPSDWPKDVRPISMKGAGLLGIDPDTNKLYWDGKEVAMKSVTSLATPERVLAGLGLLIALGGLIVSAGDSFEWWR